MNTQTWFVIKPTTFNRRKVSYGDVLSLTESQSRPLRHGGFISADKAAADRIAELVKENLTLKSATGKQTEQEPNVSTEVNA